MHEVLTVDEMGMADRLAVAASVLSQTLMENAGRSAAEEIRKRWRPATTAILCGPGNNGGDGYVVARHLKARGWKVWVEALGDPAELKGDAAEMFRRWDGETRAITRARPAELVVDALFGAGLDRPLDHNTAAIAKALNESGLPVIAIDVPSGLHGDFGKPLGDICVRATATVTFFRKKPAHLLCLGRALCGETIVTDIGISNAVLETIRPQTFENTPLAWMGVFPWPKIDDHKYRRGHALVVSGPAHATGAARLAARGALRVGAGLVSVASPPDAVAVNAGHLTAIMVKPFADATGLSDLLNDARIKAVVIGPGLGTWTSANALLDVVLAKAAPAILDADALTCLARGSRKNRPLHGDCVLTPHEGEFERLFPGVLQRSPSRLVAAREAARTASCVVVLKGPDTIIASPDGRAAINANAPPWLATAGSGDVLAGFIGGLMAQSMASFEAACAGVWLHGESARLLGLGLIAEDLPEALPQALKALMSGADAA